MTTFSPLAAQSIETVTLKRLRLDARPVEDEMTQGEVADAIGVDSSTVSRWERGQGLKGVRHYHIVRMSLFFKKELPEIHAAIENTEKIFEDKLIDLQSKN